MSAHNDCERRLRAAFRALQAVPGIDTRTGEIEGQVKQSPIRSEVNDAMWDQFGTGIPSVLEECSLSRTPLACYWRIENPRQTLIGEFNLHPPLSSIPDYPPSLDWSMPEFERMLSEEFLVIDDFPEGGTDAYVALRLRPGAEPLEIWYHEAERGALLLDLDYCTYMRTLAVAKGALGWQFLFADVSLSEPEFNPFAKGLKGALAMFPRLFPRYDYTPLQERLEARL
jgi:hypothetical protein